MGETRPTITDQRAFQPETIASRGVESLIERRARWRGETADPALLRLSVGIEAVDDLWADPAQALG
ncbi:MAG TPA: hypothetical protein VFU81_17300 [Thermomicrobiales bacterium]|nr:hypothetical protein [Thermomicrobiales bacterium]